MKHFIFACYRPPNESPYVFFGTLSSLLDEASKESSYLTLLGDFNARHSTWDSQTNTAGTRLFQLLLDFGLSQCVKEPTRFASNLQSSSTIDLYATTRPDLVTNVNVTDPISDHCCVTVETTDPYIKPGPSEMLIDDFSRADWSGMLKALQLSQAPFFTAIQGTTNIDIAWLVWHDICRCTNNSTICSKSGSPSTSG